MQPVLHVDSRKITPVSRGPVGARLCPSRRKLALVYRVPGEEKMVVFVQPDYYTDYYLFVSVELW